MFQLLTPDDVSQIIHGATEAEALPRLANTLNRLLGSQQFNANQKFVSDENDLRFYAHSTGIQLFLGKKKKISICKIDIKGQDDQINEMKFIAADAIEGLLGWQQVQFLIKQVYYLLRLYFIIKSKPDNEKVIIHDKAITCQVLCDEILGELQVAANAYRIIHAYLPLVIDSKPSSALHVFAEYFVSALRGLFTQSTKLIEVSFPCGTYCHAVYLCFTQIDKDRVMLRIDNIGVKADEYHAVDTRIGSVRILPYLVGEFSLQALLGSHKEKFIAYIVSICALQAKITDFASGLPGEYLDELYRLSKAFKQYSLRSTFRETGLEPVTPQSVDNCVYENYNVGMTFRLRDGTELLPEKMEEWFDVHERIMATTAATSFSLQVGTVFQSVTTKIKDQQPPNNPGGEVLQLQPRNTNPIYDFPATLTEALFFADDRQVDRDGRLATIDIMHTKLIRHKRTALSGLPGSGKTTLALKYADLARRNRYFHIIKYFTLDATILTQFKDFVLALLPDLVLEESASIDFVATAYALLAKLNKPWLVIFDRAKPKAMRQFFPSELTELTLHGHLLVVSHQTAWAPLPVQTLRGYSVAETVMYVDALPRQQNHEHAMKLTKLLDYHPYALLQVKCWLDNSPMGNVADILALLAEDADDFFRSEPALPKLLKNPQIFMMMSAVIDAYLNQASQHTNTANQLIEILAHLPESTLPLLLIQNILLIISHEATLTPQLKQLLNDMLNYNLAEINMEAGNISFPSLIRTTSRMNKYKVNGPKTALLILLGALDRSFTYSYINPMLDEVNYLHCLPIVEGVLNSTTSWSKEYNVLLAKLFTKLAHYYYYEVSDLDKALQYYERAIELSQSCNLSIELLSELKNNYASLLIRQAMSPENINIIENICLEVLGYWHDTLLTVSNLHSVFALTNLAYSKREANQPQAARAYLLRCQQYLQTCQGDSDWLNHTRSYLASEIGMTYSLLGQPKEYIVFAELAIKFKKKVCAAARTELIMLTYNLAIAYEQDSNFTQAIVTLEAAIRMATECYGKHALCIIDLSYRLALYKKVCSQKDDYDFIAHFNALQDQYELRSIFDTTCLEMAVEAGALNHVVFLISEKGANPQQRNRRGHTILLTAVENNQLEIVRTLLESNFSSLEEKDNAGRDALKIAEDGHHADMLTYLTSYKKQLGSHVSLLGFT